MTVFADLTDDQIKSIFDWVDSQDPNATAAGPGNLASVETGEDAEEEGLPWMWILLGIMFVIIIMAVSGVRRQLKIATKESESTSDSLTYIDEFKIWAWKYRLYVGLATLVLVLSGFDIPSLNCVLRVDTLFLYFETEVLLLFLLRISCAGVI